jgi:diguanylate cyclase (GGDEF)-like protein/PAS domain S-box-containing protein
MKIGHKIISWFMFFTIIPWIVISTIVYFALVKSFETSAGNDLMDKVIGAAITIDQFMINRSQDLEALSNSPIFELNHSEDISTYLKNIVDVYPFYDELIYADANGNIVASSDASIIGKNFLALHEDNINEFQKSMIDTGKGVYVSDFSNHINHTEDEPHLDLEILTNVKNIHGEITGVIVGLINVDVIRDLVFDIDERTIGDEYAYLVDDPGNILITADPDVMILSPHPDLDIQYLQEKLEGDENGFIIYINSKGRKVISGYADLNEYGKEKVGDWSLLSTAPYEDIMAPLYSLYYKIILILLFILTLTLFAGIFIVRTITNPVIKLKDAATKIGRGEFIKEIDISSEDEIGILAQTLVDMSTSLKQKNTELIIEKEKAEENEERFSLAMQGANDGLWDWDLKTDKVYYSPRWKSMLGYTEDEIKDDLSEGRRLLHPDDEDKVFSEVDAFIKGKIETYEVELRMQHKVGHYINILSRAFAVKDKNNDVIRLVGTHVDITSRKKVEEQLSYQSSHDALTELVNRREFERRIKRLLSTIQQSGQEHALCYLDLDQFKVVNDTCGHTAGDEMLRQISSMLQKVVRHRDTLARLGGDEFGILMEHCSIEDANRVAISIQKAIQEYQFIWKEKSFRVGVSIGLAPITMLTASLTQLLKDADAACYIAKEKGRNRIHVHHIEDIEIAQHHGEMLWVARINEAIEENRFCLYAQPIVAIDGSNERHYELLLRMIGENGEIIPPGAFLPAAERYNIIVNIDFWVINKVFELIKENPEFLKKNDSCSINLSGQSLTDMKFQEFVISKLIDSGFSLEKICFEITETAAISNLNAAKLFLTKIKELGCKFSLDDFGSGLSSFGYLKNFEVDYLKIDGMFVRDIIDDPIDHAMVKSINEIGQVMGMKTVAEFVENDVIKGMLTEIGVNFAQGYGLGKPIPFDEVID